MKTKSLIALIAVVCFGLTLAAAGCNKHRRGAENKNSAETASSPESTAASTTAVELSISAPPDDKVDLAEKEEVRRKFQLKPGSLVNLRNINGKVTVETAATDTAEILIVRSAKTREDLKQYRQVKIEQEENRLVIFIENDRKSLFSSLGSIPEGRQRVILKLPRTIDFESSSINGDLILGETQGRVELRRISGELKATRLSGATDIDGVNGNVDVSFAPLKGNSIEVNGVNGNIDLHFEGEVNADLTTWGINGQVNADLPGVENRDEESGRGRMKARIGAGGTQIRINGINGNLNLLKADKSAPAAKVAAK